MSILLSIFGAISQGLLWSIMGLGVYITFRILDFADMTCEGSFTLGGCVSATLVMGLHLNPFLSLIAGAIAGGAAGLVTGILHTKLKIPAILAGILTMISLYSINLRIMGQSNKPIMTKIDGIDTTLSLVKKYLSESMLANKNINNIITLVIGLIIVIIVIALLYWFFGTEAGCALRATGNNEAMVRALGVNTDSMKILGLVIANALVALSGALVTHSNGTADVGQGIGAIVIGLASIVIGEVIFSRKSNFVVILISIVVGSAIYRIIIAVVLQLGLQSSDLRGLTAIVVALALSVPLLIPQKRSGKIQGVSDAKDN